MLWPEVPYRYSWCERLSARSMGPVPWNSRTQELPVLSSRPEVH